MDDTGMLQSIRNGCNILLKTFVITNYTGIFADVVSLIKKEVSMYKYKLVKKINPMDRKAAKKWYAVPVSEVPQTVKAMTRAATENTTTAPIEMEAALDLLGKHARHQLQQGHTVRLGDLGTIRVTFKSDGVEDITKFNAGAMIKNPRIIFTPSKEFRESVLQGIQFQNGGVLDEGVSYASLADYKTAKSITGGGNMGGSSGGDGNQEENPLG